MTAPDPTAGEREPSPSTLWPHGPIVGHPKHDYYVCGSCHQPLAPGPCPAKMPTQPDPPTFDSLLSDPTQQLDSEGVVIRSIAASTGTSEDVEALAREVCPCSDDPDGTHVPDLDAGCGWALALCRAVLASDWLAAREAAARAEERERIAQAIEALSGNHVRKDRAARIAREGRP